MKEFYSIKKANSAAESIFFLFGIMILVGVMNASKTLSIWITITLFIIGSLFIIIDYFQGEFPNVVRIDSRNQILQIGFTNNNGKGTRDVVLNYTDTYFIYEYEQMSRTSSMPVLKIFEGKIEINRK